VARTGELFEPIDRIIKYTPTKKIVTDCTFATVWIYCIQVAPPEAKTSIRSNIVLGEVSISQASNKGGPHDRGHSTRPLPFYQESYCIINMQDMQAAENAA
jgi:hypothetical protein